MIKLRTQKYTLLRVLGSSPQLERIYTVQPCWCQPNLHIFWAKGAGFRTPTGARVTKVWPGLNTEFCQQDQDSFYQGQIACQRHFDKNLPKYSISCLPDTLLHCLFNSGDI